MHSLQLWFERWLFPTMVHHYWRVGFWIRRRSMIHYDVDRDRLSKLVAAIHDVDLELMILRSDIRSGQVPCHTVAVSQLMADYFL